MMKYLILFSFILCADLDTTLLTKITHEYADNTSEVIEFHDNGNVKLKAYYKGKFRHGKWVYYNKRGLFTMIEMYHNGRLQNKWGDYDEKASK